MKFFLYSLLTLFYTSVSNLYIRANPATQTPTEKITSTSFGWPQITTVLIVTAVTFGGLIMWEWLYQRE